MTQPIPHPIPLPGGERDGVRENFKCLSIEFILYLACLGEAASAKAGACNLVLSYGYILSAKQYALFFKRSFCSHIPRGDLNSFSRFFIDAVMMG